MDRTVFLELSKQTSDWLLSQDLDEKKTVAQLRACLFPFFEIEGVWGELRAHPAEVLDEDLYPKWAAKRSDDPAHAEVFTVLNMAMFAAIQANKKAGWIRGWFDAPTKDYCAEFTKAFKATRGVPTSGKGNEAVYVYGFDHDPGYLKIGLAGREGSVRAVYKRIMEQIGTSNRALPTLHQVFFTDDCHTLERYIHKKLKRDGKWVDAGAGTEWFQVTLEDVKSLVASARTV